MSDESNDPIAAAAAQLVAAIETLKPAEDLRVYPDPAASVIPPGVVIGPPALQWEGQHTEPIAAVFPVFVVVALDTQAMPRLWRLVPLVSTAIETNTVDAVVRRGPSGATPVTFAAGAAELPAYLINVEMEI